MTNEIQTTWIDEELDITQKSSFEGERLPSLKLESGKITKFVIDVSNKFNKWSDGKGITKALIPVTHKGEKKIFWLNTKNPLYSQILERIKKGQTEFNISTTGNLKDTRYTIVDEE